MRAAVNLHKGHEDARIDSIAVLSSQVLALPSGFKEVSADIADARAGDVLLVGYVEDAAGKKRRGWAGRAGAKTTWSRTWPSKGKTRISAGLLRPGGGGVLAGRSMIAGFHQLRLRAIDGAGVTQWTRTTGDKTDKEPSGIVADSAGAVIGGLLASGWLSKPWLRAVDQQGRLRWQRVYGKGDSARQGVGPRSLLRTAAGELVLVTGLNRALGTFEPLVIRADPWGHADCAGAGTCVVRAPTSCDDADPCTADLCLAAGGCAHPAIKGCKGATP